MLNPLKIVSKLFKSGNQKELDRISIIVNKVNELEEKISKLRDEEFPKKTEELKNKIKEGDLITPIGEYKIKFVLYRKDRLKNLSTKLKKIIIKKNMGWCDDPSSKKYNQLVYLPFSYSHEKLYVKENIYDIILVLDYNMNPIVKDKGSAIFIHVAKKNY